MLQHNPQHVSSSTLLIFRRKICIIPEAVIIQFVLLKMSKVLLQTCWGLCC